MDQSTTQCRQLLRIATPLLAGLDDSHLALQPQPGLKTAGWLLGHLAVTGDFGRRLCGQKPICPKEWREPFSPGSQPSMQRAEYPSMEELRSAVQAVYSDFAQSALTADSSALAQPNPYEPTRGAFPTTGHFVSYLLGGHFAWHLGQLFAWRAAVGIRSS